MSVPSRIRNNASLGLLISLYLFSCAGTTEQIVETESHVVLEVGARGILPCRIQTKAHLVQWTRHLISEHLLVYLNPYANVDLRGGPGYKEGFFNITEDYSLIIKDVKVQDEGLYICEVSDFQTGKVFRNKTRVSVRGTGVSVALEMGARGILPCRTQRGAYEVKWKRQLSSNMSETELLVSVDQFSKVGERDGPGYEAGLFNITEDYSLVIKDVKVQDEGLYMCTIFDFKTGRVSRNSTRVFVQAFPEEPFPNMQECMGIDVYRGACTLTVNSTSNLTCFVDGYYPDIDLFFLHGSQKMTSTKYEEWHNADGTKNKTIKIEVSVSDEPYQCVASGLPGMVGNRSVSVILLQARPQTPSQARSQGLHAAAIVIPVLVVVGSSLSIAAVVFFLYRRGKKRGLRGEPGSIPALEGTHLNEYTYHPSGSIPTTDDLDLISIDEDSYHPSSPISTSDDLGLISNDALCPGGNRRYISLSFKRSILRRWFFQGLFRPHDVIYHKGKYFITDTGHQCLSSYNPETRAHKTECRVLGSSLNALASLSDPDQGILVTDYFRGLVYRIDNTGGYYEWASGLNGPTGITTHKGKVFIAEFSTNNIKVYNEKGKYLRNFDSETYLRKPWFLAVNSKNRLYVADSEAIKVFTTVGEYIESFKISNEGKWLNRGITIDCYDNVFVTARDGRELNAIETIAVFNSEHRCVKRFTADTDTMHCLRGLCVNYDHNELVVVDGEWHRLKLFELYESALVH